ncbi:major capsid protein [Paeniglutamicibacter terrestris]|uniref:Major capsid protein E n=1 Tax=Paeniglutamicibacter terrestris TaxID=2723403 RepID=A0ABX1G4D5_9MICC|nr:major capsid protein [Paeniglutamicibacter terrestris]NKG21103.1 major capsid protein E [Paeniglutamicibacter terrestris]
MAIVFDGDVTPDALTAFVRSVPTPANYVLDQLLPNRTFTKNQIDFSELTRTNRAAKFRAYDGSIVPTKRDTLTSSTVKLPPLSSMNGVGERERLELEHARQGGSSNSALIDQIYDDATLLTGEILTRMELARGDVLADGKFTLAGENGLTLEADFGVPSNHLVTTAAAWSTPATAKIIEDLTTWVSTYVVTNGQRPGGMAISDKVLGYMLRNAEIRSLAASLSGAPSLVTRPALDAVLDAFSLPPIKWVYDTRVDVDDVDTRVLPENAVIFTPANPSDLGYTAWGVSATALELVNSAKVDFAFSEAPGIVGVVDKSAHPPYRENTFVDAVGMPVLTNPKLLFVGRAY